MFTVADVSRSATDITVSPGAIGTPGSTATAVGVNGSVSHTSSPGSTVASTAIPSDACQNLIASRRCAADGAATPSKNPTERNHATKSSVSRPFDVADTAPVNGRGPQYDTTGNESTSNTATPQPISTPGAANTADTTPADDERTTRGDDHTRSAEAFTGRSVGRDTTDTVAAATASTSEVIWS